MSSMTSMVLEGDSSKILEGGLVKYDKTTPVTTPVVQFVGVFPLSMGGLGINADLWQHFPRPAPTQEMAVTVECSLGQHCASQHPQL